MTAGNGRRSSVRGDSERQTDSQLAQLVEQHARVPSLFRDLPAPIVLYDLDGNIVVGNRAAIHLLGHAPGTLVGSHYSAHLAPKFVADAQRVSELAGQGQTAELDAVFVHADGHPVHVSTTIFPARFDDAIVGVYGIVREVRREREVAAALEQADRFRALYLIAATSGKTPQQQIDDTLLLGSSLLNVDSGIVMRATDGSVQPSHAVGSIPLEALQQIALETGTCRKLFGSFETIAVDDVRRPPWNREPVRSILPWQSFIATTFEIGGTFAGIVLFGSQHERGELFSSSDREVVALIGAVVGSTIDRQLQQERLDALAFSDTLTGLPNRALLQDRLEQLIAESRRNHESFAVHFLDLDGFKHVNDTGGHAEGDKVLREAASRLKTALRESDCVARLGGDEFIVLQRQVREPSEAVSLARALLELMRLPFVVDAGAFILSASIGISLFPVDGENANSLVRSADVALYRAKSSGRNGFALFCSAPQTAPFAS